MLNYINYNHVVYLSKCNEYDDFGIPITSEFVSCRCYYRESTKLEPSLDGSLYLLQYSVTVEGDCDFNIGDALRLNDQIFTIRSKKVIRDFDLNVVATRFEV